MAFVLTPGNPAPAGAQEVWFEGRNATGQVPLKLRALLAPATGPGRGSVLLLPGYTEFIEKYFEVAGELQARGFAVFLPDWRGQGLSERPLSNPLKAHLESFDDPAGDLAHALSLFADDLARPHVVLAHSMGGSIALRALQTKRLDVDAAFFCAPMWGVSAFRGANKSVLRGARLLGLSHSFCPGVPTRWAPEPFERNRVTHDPVRHARAQACVLAEPKLALAGVTIGWANAAISAMEGFQRPGALAHLRMPAAIAMAGEEAIVDNGEMEKTAALLPQARIVRIAGARHEILMETDPLRAPLWAAFDALTGDLASVTP